MILIGNRADVHNLIQIVKIESYQNRLYATPVQPLIHQCPAGFLANSKAWNHKNLESSGHSESKVISEMITDPHHSFAGELFTLME
jgi:hypothetical protein